MNTISIHACTKPTKLNCPNFKLGLKSDAIMEERRLLEEEKARQEQEERQQNKAATTIQAAWRGYQFRKLTDKKAKKEKKTGKKGKNVRSIFIELNNCI